MTPTEAQSHVRRGVLKYLTSQMAERFDARIRVEAMKLKLALATQPKAGPRGVPCLLFPDASVGEQAFAYFDSVNEARAEAERLINCERCTTGRRRYVLAVATEFLVATKQTKWVHSLEYAVDEKTPVKPAKPSKKKARK